MDLQEVITIDDITEEVETTASSQPRAQVTQVATSSGPASWTSDEEDTLVQVLYECKDRRFLEETKALPKEKRDMAWDWVCEKFNLRTAGDEKTVDQIKNKVKNHKAKYKARRSNWLAEHNLTGGGSMPIESELPAWWDARVEEMYHKKMNPLSNSFDSDANHHLRQVEVLDELSSSQPSSSSSSAGSSKNTVGNSTRKRKRLTESHFQQRKEDLLNKFESLINEQRQYIELKKRRVLSETNQQEVQNTHESMQPSLMHDHQY